MSKKDEEDKSALARASERVKTAALTAAKEALHPEKVKSALAMKLIVVGFALTALAGGMDYFSNDDAIHKVVSGFAREAGYNGVAEWVDWWDLKVDDYKAMSIEKCPPQLRSHLAGAALAIGVIALGAGIRMKIKEHHPVHGNVLRDVGRAIAGPGFVGVMVFVLLSFHGALIVRRSFWNMFHQLQTGELTWGGVWDLIPHYAPWAYSDAAGVLWLGIGLGVVAIGAKLGERRIERLRIPVEVARRTASWGAVLSLAYFVAAIFVAVVSYGGALPVITWPWKVDPGAFLAALVFMSFGMGLDRTGTAMIRAEQLADEKAGKKK